MKKFLALVLALVMTLGLATVSSNAATTYADADSIRYKEAVDVMSAIGILAGMEDGKFQPTGELTREQGAKIITYMVLGQKAADALAVSTAPFDDVAADRWSAGSIAYCKSLGILAGVGDNKFDPTAPLTGAAFAKMLLTALGYDAAREGLTGSDWQLNVARLVNATNLSDELDAMPYNSTLTRQEAAQMALNTMETTMVNYNGNNLTVDREGNLAAPRANVQNGTYSYSGAADGVMQFVENYYPNLKKEVGVDDYGTPTVFWFNGNTRNDNVRTDAKTVSTAPDGDQVLVYNTEVKAKDIYKDLGLSAAATLTLVDTNGDGVNDTRGIWVDGYGYTNAAIVAIDGVNYTNAALTTTISSGNDTKIGGNGVETTVVYDKTANLVTISLKNTYVFQALSDYNTSTKKLSLAMGSALDPTLNSASGDPSKDDYFECVLTGKKDDLFLGTVTYNGANLELQTLEPATDLVEDAKINGYKATDTVTAAGTTYKYTKNMASAAAFGNALYAATYTMSDTATYDFVLYKGFVAMAKVHTKDNVAQDYLFVRDVSVSGFNVYAKVTFMDGTESTIQIAKVNDETVASDASKDATNQTGAWTAPAGNTVTGTDTKVYALHFYTFTKNSSGNYLLTAVADQGSNGTALVSDKAQPITGVAKTATNDTVIVAKKTAYKGVKNVPAVAAKVFYVFDGAYLTVAYTGTAGVSSSSTSEIVYLFANPSTTKEGDDTIYVYDAIKDGEKTTIRGQQAGKSGMIGIKSYDSKTNAADLNTASTAEDYSADFANVVEVENAVLGGAISHKDGTYTDGTNNFILTDDAKIYLVDISDKSVDEISAGTLSGLDGAVAYDVYSFQKSTTDTNIYLVYLVKA